VNDQEHLVHKGASLSAQSATARSLSYLSRVDIGVLTTAIPAELVDEVIDRAGCREQRHRRLPARVVMYFVLGLCLFSAAEGFRPPGYRTVIRTLSRRCGGVFSGARHVGDSALTQARQRLGVKPVQMLFEELRGPATSRPESWSHAFGRRVVAWDGTTIAVPDSPDNAAAFGHHGHGTDSTDNPSAEVKRGGAATGANPLVRMMTLVECGSHAIIDVAFDGVARASEQVLARQLLASLAPGMLLLADRNFLSYPLWNATLGTGADLLWRIKSSSHLVPTKHLPDGSYLAILPTPAETRRLGQRRRNNGPNEIPREGHQIRVIEFTITVHTDSGETRNEHYRLATNLHDHAEAPAEQLAALYNQRWESENSNSELKPRLIGDATLRSRTPEGVTQEIYAFLCVYQALIALRVDAATTAKLDPDRISFLITIREVRADIADHSTRRHATRKRAIVKQMIEDRLPPRRPRSSPRQRIPHANKYPAKRRDQPRPSTKTRTKITVSRARNLN
jgi:hypothetical protein